MAGLTAKRERFVEEFLLDLNAKQAAIRSADAHYNRAVGRLL
jgi:phage terminase small subunit